MIKVIKVEVKKSLRPLRGLIKVPPKIHLGAPLRGHKKRIIGWEF